MSEMDFKTLLLGRTVRLINPVDFDLSKPELGILATNTPVKIVHISRFWLIGITPDLNSDRYKLRCSAGDFSWDSIVQGEAELLGEMHALYLRQMEQFRAS